VSERIERLRAGCLRWAAVIWVLRRAEDDIMVVHGGWIEIRRHWPCAYH
jgi:hypothetical protein